MNNPDIISVVESSLHPNYTALYRGKGLYEVKVNSIRKSISLIKKCPVQYIVSEFFYAYSTNYSGVHQSNLEVLLLSLQKYSPQTRVIVLVEKTEQQFIKVLDRLDYPLYAVLAHPVSSEQMERLL